MSSAAGQITRKQPKQSSIFRPSLDPSIGNEIEEISRVDYANDNIYDPQELYAAHSDEVDFPQVEKLSQFNSVDQETNSNTTKKQPKEKGLMHSLKLNKNSMKECQYLRESHMCDCSVCECQNKREQGGGAEDQSMLKESDDSSIDDHFGIIDQKKLKYRQEYPYPPDEKPLEKDYAFILTRLQPVKRSSRALRLFVPETIAFSQGEAKLLAYTPKDKMMRFIRQKERLNLQELRKFMNKKRYKYRFSVDQLEAKQQARNNEKNNSSNEGNKNNSNFNIIENTITSNGSNTFNKSNLQQQQQAETPEYTQDHVISANGDTQQKPSSKTAIDKSQQFSKKIIPRPKSFGNTSRQVNKPQLLLNNKKPLQQQQQQQLLSASHTSGNLSGQLTNPMNSNNLNNSNANASSSAVQDKLQNRDDAIKEKDSREAVIIKYDIEIEQKKNQDGNYVNAIPTHVNAGNGNTNANNANNNNMQNSTNNNNNNNNQTFNGLMQQIQNFNGSNSVPNGQNAVNGGNTNHYNKQQTTNTEKFQKQISLSTSRTPFNGQQLQGQQLSHGQNSSNNNNVISSQQFNQVLNELEFLNLMMKRKIDPVWNTILFVQNCLRLKKRQMEFIRLKFRYEEDQWHPLFNRALIDVQMISGDISQASQDYIPIEVEMEFEDKLMKTNQETYVKYMCFKIVHFVETFYNSKITRMRTEWLQDDFGNIYFINASKVKHQPKGKAALSSDMYMKKLEMTAEKKLQSNVQLENQYLNIQKREILDIFTDMLFKEEEKKDKQLAKEESKKRIKEKLIFLYSGKKSQSQQSQQSQNGSKSKGKDELVISPYIISSFLTILRSPQPVQEFKKFIYNQNNQTNGNGNGNSSNSSSSNKLNSQLMGSHSKNIKNNNNNNTDGLMQEQQQLQLPQTFQKSASVSLHKALPSVGRSVFVQRGEQGVYQDINFKVPSMQPESETVPLKLTYKVRREQSTLNSIKIENRVFSQLYGSPLFSKSRFVQNYPRIDNTEETKRTLPFFLYSQEAPKIAVDGKARLKNFHILS